MLQINTNDVEKISKKLTSLGLQPFVILYILISASHDIKTLVVVPRILLF